MPLLAPKKAEDGTEMVVEISFTTSAGAITGAQDNMQEMLLRANKLEAEGKMKEAAELVAMAMEQAAMASAATSGRV